jgi:hypothetical protein
MNIRSIFEGIFKRPLVFYHRQRSVSRVGQTNVDRAVQFFEEGGMPNGNTSATRQSPQSVEKGVMGEIEEEDGRNLPGIMPV